MTGLTASRAYGILALRVVTGFYFLWAGLDKLFTFIGGAEPFSAAGFLSFGTAGTTSAAVAEGTIVNPTAPFWADVASNTALLSTIDVLVPVGQILIGTALILGFATRFSAVMGFLMMAFITTASWDFAHGWLNSSSFLGIVALILGVIRAGEVYGVDALIDEQPIVKRTPVLRYVLG
ncbi:MAG TPA: DoxX family membrane protein [Candidatus Limnocylindria bacterium]|nr:DoxX family membrane protein [Candidatus Limnocylindria bacterium]